MLKGINWTAVAVAVLVLEVIGFVWYAVLFVKPWTAALVAFGHTPTGANVAVMQSLGVINTLALVLGLAWLTRRLGVSSMTGCIGVALTAWLVFGFTTQSLEYLFMELPATFLAINAGYQIVAYAVAGAILGFLKSKTAYRGA